MMAKRWKFRLLLDVDEMVFTCAYSSKIRKHEKTFFICIQLRAV